MAAKIDYAYTIIKGAKRPLKLEAIFKKLMKEIDIEATPDRMADLYTELCTDGRFLVLEDGSWDLKTNYSLKDIEAEINKRVFIDNIDEVEEDVVEEELEEVAVDMNTLDDSVEPVVSIEDIIDDEDDLV